ncbi:MAG: B12-binding domain-containing radical SAM protein [Phycisphaerales bacterium]|nr:MAG: B12-binding domain-containing radical SAM protein [Phycisphaerales bacterium]
MQVVLVSTYTYPLALGLRYVSSFLKRAGHDVTMLFMSSERDEAAAGFAQPLLDDFVQRCQPADVVGLSLMTNSFYRSCVLTEAIRKAGVKAPIVWGGTHPTVAPQESARVADYVCIGEGEKVMVEFVEALQAGRDPSRTRNFAYLRNGDLVRNPTCPLTDDLDDYPFPDYNMKGHWVAHKDKLVPAEPKRLRGALRRYRMSSTRGCPYSCSFCNNSTQMRIYQGPGLGKWVRKRSNASIIAEIEGARERYPSIEAVNLIDDLFLIRNEEEVAQFVEVYEERVNLPLDLDAFPNTVTDRKIKLLSRLPIDLISMGIQSGSEDTLRRLYHRPTKTDTIARAVRILSDHGVHAEYHYLVANPFEPEDNMRETLRFVADHHRGPAKTRIFPLQLYPGSAMYERARKEGVIGEHHEEAYRFTYAGKKHIMQASYLDIWLRIVLALRVAGVPSWWVHRVIDFALHRWVRRCLDNRLFAPAAYIAYRTGRMFYKNLIYKPFVRPVTALTARRRRRRRRSSREHVQAEMRSAA